MSYTIYHRNFKKIAGSVNHYFITSYIGVSNIDEKTTKPTTLSTHWDPKNIKLTKVKTIHYLSNSGILNMCAMVEAYINDITKDALPFAKDEPHSPLNISDKDSIKKKFDLVNELLNIDIKSDAFNLTLLMFTHRNNIIHSGKTKLESDIKNRINSSGQSIKKNYKNLDVKNLIKHVNSFEALSFKETISLFSAAHKYVESVDRILSDKLNKISYLKNKFETEDAANKFFLKLSMENNKDRKEAKILKFIEINYGISINSFHGEDMITEFMAFLNKYI